MWKTSRRKAFTPTGVTHGATATGSGRALPWHTSTPWITGQVWSRAQGPRTWWVATADRHAYLMHESTTTALGLCDEVALFGAETA